MISKPYGRCESLSQWSCGDRYVFGIAIFWVSWCFRPPSAQCCQIGHFDSGAGSEKLQVQGQRGVAGGEDESIAAFPVLVGRVEVHYILEKLPRYWRQGERRTWVTGANLFDGICGKHPQRVNYTLVLIRVDILASWQMSVECSRRF